MIGCIVCLVPFGCRRIAVIEVDRSRRSHSHDDRLRVWQTAACRVTGSLT
ncbi:hypothetical protein F750_1658 [Streptomyces sp. PAMC 26508]|nr:hypothetical protein F750_1658 [Streptomyces sp. PAMC 26508]